MSRTFRTQYRCHHTRQSFIQNWMNKHFLSLLRSNEVAVRIPEKERRALRDAKWSDYVQAWYAWYENGAIEGLCPHRPFATPRYKRTPLTPELFELLLKKEFQKAESFWEKTTRDGGFKKTSNWHFYGRKSAKQQRRYSNQTVKNLTKNPDGWMDATYKDITQFPDIYPDYW